MTDPMNPVPLARVSPRNDRPVRSDRAYVLYWMIANRRAGWNFALDHAVARARELGKPLVVLEALRCGHRWASRRFHRFVLDGMEDNAKRFETRGVLYVPYIEPRDGAGKGLLEALGRDACAVVTDDFPAFFLPRMVAAAAKRLDVRLEAVDANGLYPMRTADRVFPTAHAFRRHLQKELPLHLADFPEEDPLRRARLPRLERLPAEIERRWPAGPVDLERIPVDHEVGEVETRGGSVAGERRLRAFLEEKLPRYADDRNEPEKDGASGLSPYLHFGHVSVHQILAALSVLEPWSPGSLSRRATGSREGWWGMSRAAEAFLDELVTWREVGYNFAALREDHDRYESLPEWCRATLDAHRADPRPYLYDLDAFERADTHDPLWNAAQTQLAREGKIHNYLRMLWGKKILEWSASPEEAASIMIELNNKYALDGRNPNSYSGIFWVLGRYDRPWGPERPIFGTIRYMSSENTARKFHVRDYVARYAPDREGRLL
jgi:deoxyribodipyrimidine photo-lyase